MTDNIQTAAPAPQAGEQGSDQSGEPQSTPERSSSKPSLLERLSSWVRPRNGSSLREDLEDALADTSEADGGTSFSPAERAMLNNILRLREQRVEDVMVPRSDIEALDTSTTLGDLLTLFEENGRSRMPVYHEALDDPRGMIHIRDVVAFVTRAAKQKRGRATRKQAASTAALDLANVDLSKPVSELGIIRPVLFVPPSMLASDLMTRMQAARIQMALVIDEYGGTDGLVSLEDIVEMVVGDIEDEHDEDEAPLVTQTAEGVFIVDAKAEIDDVAEVIGSSFVAGEHGDYVDTIGGLIFNALGRVPARGEVVQAIPGFEFHVLDADPRRVKRVRIVQGRSADRRRAKASAASEQPELPAGAVERSDA